MAEETLRIAFHGGIAAEGRLQFYEYSRSQYATARFIATIEHFRRTGKIADKIIGASYVDMVVTTPQRGSFIYDVAVQTTATVTSGAIVGFVAFVWHLLAPRREKVDSELIKLAQFKLFEQQQITAQAVEQTRQLELLRDIVNGQRAPVGEAVELMKWSVETSNTQFSELELSLQERADALKELEAERDREDKINRSGPVLEGFDDGDLNRLTSRLRPMVPEMALPLKRSAKTMSIGGPGTSDNVIFLDEEIVELVRTRAPEEDTVTIRGRIKSYDRDAGVGKVQSSELHRVLNFTVPVSRRARLRDWILAAMQREAVNITLRRVLDDSGLPTSLILIDITFDQEIES